MTQPVLTMRPLTRGGEHPRIASLPFTVPVGAFAMMLVVVNREIRFGPISLSGSLTLVVAILTFFLLVAYTINAPERPLLAGVAPARVPWPIWAFLLLVSMGLVNSALAGTTSIASIQNACIYIAFVGAIAVTAGTTSPALVQRGWELLRTFSTGFAYLALVASALGVGPVAADRAGPSRAMAVVGLVALAIVIPGVPRNAWEKFAPFAMVAAMALTLSRTATTIGLACLVFLALRRRRATGGELGGRFSKALVLLAAVAFSAYTLVVYYAPFRDRFLGGDSALQFGNFNISTQGRIEMWKVVLSHADNWLFGQGVGAAPQLILEHFPGLDHPHNEYLRFYFDFGVIGAALFFSGYMMLGWRSLRNARRSDHPLHWATVIALLAIASVAVTDNPLVYPFVMLPLGALVGLSLALTQFEQSGRSFVAEGDRSPTNRGEPDYRGTD